MAVTSETICTQEVCAPSVCKPVPLSGAWALQRAGLSQAHMLSTQLLTHKGRTDPGINENTWVSKTDRLYLYGLFLPFFLFFLLFFQCHPKMTTAFLHCCTLWTLSRSILIICTFFLNMAARRCPLQREWLSSIFVIQSCLQLPRLPASLSCFSS